MLHEVATDEISLDDVDLLPARMHADATRATHATCAKHAKVQAGCAECTAKTSKRVDVQEEAKEMWDRLMQSAGVQESAQTQTGTEQAGSQANWAFDGISGYSLLLLLPSFCKKLAKIVIIVKIIVKTSRANG